MRAALILIAIGIVQGTKGPRLNTLTFLLQRLERLAKTACRVTPLGSAHSLRHRRVIHSAKHLADFAVAQVTQPPQERHRHAAFFRPLVPARQRRLPES